MRTRADPRRRAPGPDHGGARRADLPDDLVRVRGRRGRGRPVRAAEVREHLHRASATRPSPRSRSASPASRAASARSPPPAARPPRRCCSRSCASAGEHIVRQRRALRRHLHAARRDAAPARGRDDVRRRRRPRRVRGRGPARAARSSLYTEIVANPAGTVADLEALADVAARRRACRSWSTRRSPRPYLCRPLELRRRHRHALGDEVPRRPRHVDRRRRSSTRARSRGTTATSRS